MIVIAALSALAAMLAGAVGLRSAKKDPVSTSDQSAERRSEAKHEFTRSAWGETVEPLPSVLSYELRGPQDIRPDLARLRARAHGLEDDISE